ncbi:hypothetical protein ABT039_22430 [Streptomyces lasiicapitis]|uniref:hypothetical protein n=1 Tax=Streptomyces lasiicapitis TaxID=1923961 RepID=UPI00332B1769
MSTPTVDVTLPGTATPAATAYLTGVAEGLVDATTTTPDITTVRAAWIDELAEHAFAQGYRAGLTFDRALETATRRSRS